MTAHAKSVLVGCVFYVYKIKFFAIKKRTVRCYSLHTHFLGLCEAAEQSRSLK